MQNEDQIRILVESLREETQRHPEDSTLWYNLGVAQGMLGASEEAIAAFRTAIQHNPEDVASHFNLGCSLLETGAPQEALIEFEEVTKLDPKMAKGFFMLGTTHGALHQTEKLIQATEAGLKLEPDSAGALFNLGLACNRLHRFEEAVNHFTRLISLDNQDPRAHFELGKAYRGLNRTDAEMQVYRDIIALDRIDCYVDASLHLGAAFLKTKRASADDVKYIDSGGEFRLDDPEHNFYWGLAQLANGHVDGAITAASRLKESSPELFRELLRYAIMEGDSSHPISERSGFMEETDSYDVNFAMMIIAVLQGQGRRWEFEARKCYGGQAFEARTDLKRFLKHEAQKSAEKRSPDRSEVLESMLEFARENEGACPKVGDLATMDTPLNSISRSLCENLVMEAQDLALQVYDLDEKRAFAEADRKQEREQAAKQVHLEKEERLKREKFQEKVEALRKAEEQKAEDARYAEIREEAERHALPRREANLRELRKNGKPPHSATNKKFIDKDQV